MTNCKKWLACVWILRGKFPGILSCLLPGFCTHLAVVNKINKFIFTFAKDQHNSMFYYVKILLDNWTLNLLTENRGRAWRVHCSKRSTVSGSAGFRACSRKACSTTSSTSCCRPCTVCSTRRPDTMRIKSTNSSPVTSSRTWAGSKEEIRSSLSTCVLVCFYRDVTLLFELPLI